MDADMGLPGMTDAAHEPGLAALPAELLQAFVAHSRDMLALTDATGTVVWANSRFAAATGYAGRRRRACSTSRSRAAQAPRRGCRSRACSARKASDSGVLQLREPRRRAVLGRGPFGARRRPHHLDARRRDAPARARRARGAPGRAARHRAGVRPARHLGTRDSRPAKAAGTSTCSASGGSIRPRERRITTTRSRTFIPRIARAGSTPIRRAAPAATAQRYRVMQRDGKTRWIHSQWEVKNGPRGVPDRALGVMMDDTEAYEAARTLSDVNAQLKLAVDLGKIAIWRRDLRTGRIHLSDVGFELLGLAPRPEGMSLDEVQSLVHPDDLPLVAACDRAGAGHGPADATWRRATATPTAAGATSCRAASSSATRPARRSRSSASRSTRPSASSTCATPRSWRAGSTPHRARPASASGRRPSISADTDWNAQMYQLFDRFTPPTVPSFGQWLAESVHADDREHVVRESQTYFASGDGPYEIEFRSLRKDGSERWIDHAGRRRSRHRRPAPRRRRRHGRDRASSRARCAARGRRAGRLHHQPRRHRHVGGGRRRLRALERADVPPARPRAARDRAEPRGVDGARPSRRRVGRPRGNAGCRGGVAADGLRIPRPPARRQLSLAGVALGRGARRRRPAGAPGRRQLGRHREQERRVRAPAGGARRARDPGQVAVSFAHEPRAQDAAQRRPRLHPAAPDGGAPVGPVGAARQARAHPCRRRPSALAHQRRARPVGARGRRGPPLDAAGRPGTAGAPVAAAAAVAGDAARRRCSRSAPPKASPTPIRLACARC